MNVKRFSLKSSIVKLTNCSQQCRRTATIEADKNCPILSTIFVQFSYPIETNVNWKRRQNCVCANCVQFTQIGQNILLAVRYNSASAKWKAGMPHSPLMPLGNVHLCIEATPRIFARIFLRKTYHQQFSFISIFSSASDLEIITSEKSN